MHELVDLINNLLTTAKRRPKMSILHHNLKLNKELFSLIYDVFELNYYKTTKTVLYSDWFRNLFWEQCSI